MKYGEAEFNNELKERIIRYEETVREIAEQLPVEHKSALAGKDIKLDASFGRDGKDLFSPGSISFISVGVEDENGQLADLHTIHIWECSRTFLGMPVTKKIPGSKVTGELLDDSAEDIKGELDEFIEEQKALAMENGRD